MNPIVRTKICPTDYLRRTVWIREMLTGLAFQLYLEYVTRNVQEKYEELKLNVALVYADTNIVGGNILKSINRNFRSRS